MLFQNHFFPPKRGSNGVGKCLVHNSPYGIMVENIVNKVLVFNFLSDIVQFTLTSMSFGYRGKKVQWCIKEENVEKLRVRFVCVY